MDPLHKASAIFRGGKLYFSWDFFDAAVQGIAHRIKQNHADRKFTGIYGEPRGGLILAVALSHHLNLPVVRPTTIKSRKLTLWVDDIVDSGATVVEAGINNNPTSYGGYCCLLTRDTPHSSLLAYSSLEGIDSWVVFPWESSSNDDVLRDESLYHSK